MNYLNAKDTKIWLSVIIPTYNGEKWLKKAFDSIKSQSKNILKKTEIIIIDDGSQDSTKDIIKAFQLSQNEIKNIIFIEKLHIGNWVLNTNTGILSASGEYICFLHQDDFWLPNRLEVLYSLTNQHSDVCFFFHPTYFADNFDNFLGIWDCDFIKPNTKILPKQEIFHKLLIQNFISIQSSLFKKHKALDIGLLDENLWYTADWDFWLKFSKINNFNNSDNYWLYYPKALSVLRIHLESLTMQGSKNILSFENQLKTVISRHYEKLKNKIQDKKLKKLINFSIEINILFADLALKKLKKFSKLLKLLRLFISINPLELRLYIKYSRIFQRVFPRIELKFFKSS